MKLFRRDNLFAFLDKNRRNISQTSDLRDSKRVTPRTDQELHLILQNGWFDDLYDVFDDELSYFNTVNDAELTKLDIEHEISKYLEEHPFHLDLPTLYSLAQKGGNMSFVALYNSGQNVSVPDDQLMRYGQKRSPSALTSL